MHLKAIKKFTKYFIQYHRQKFFALVGGAKKSLRMIFCLSAFNHVTMCIRRRRVLDGIEKYNVRVCYVKKRINMTKNIEGEYYLLQRLKKKPIVYGNPGYWLTKRTWLSWPKEYYIARVQDVLATNLGRVFDKKGHSLVDLWFRRDVEFIHRLRNVLYGVEISTSNDQNITVKKIEKGVVLAQSTDCIYGHFLIEILPRLELVRSYINEGVPIYVGMRHDVYFEALEYAGVQRGQIVDSERYPIVSVNDAIVPVYRAAVLGCSAELEFPQFGIDVLRNIREKVLLNSDACDYGDRLYVVRGDGAQRHSNNSEELYEFLECRGFVECQPEKLSFSQQVHAFAKAKVIVGCHGSGMFNAVFCDQSCLVIDLFPACTVPTLYRILESMGILYVPVQSPEGSLIRWSSKRGHKVHLNALREALEDNGIWPKAPDSLD